MSQSDWTKSAGNSPHYHKTQDCKSRARAVLLDSQMLLFPAWAPLTKKFCCLSSHVSPWISNFQVLDRSSLLGPGKGPPSCNKRVCVSLLVRRSAVKRGLSRLYKAVLLGLCLPSGQLSGLFFHIWFTLLGGHLPLSQDGSQSDGFWEEQDSLWPGDTLTFDLQGALSPKGGKWRFLNPLLKQSFAPHCPCHDYYLRMFTRKKG